MLGHVRADGKVRLVTQNVLDEANQAPGTRLQEYSCAFRVEPLGELPKRDGRDEVVDQEVSDSLGMPWVRLARRCRYGRVLRGELEDPWVRATLGIS